MRYVLMLALITSAAIAQEPPPVGAAPADKTLHSTLLLPKEMSKPMPVVLLLDEPTVGVDPQSRERIYQMIESLRADGVSLIYTTHYMEEAERLCDRIAVIDSGRVIATGTKDELVRNTIGTKREVVVEFADGSRVTHLIDDAAEMLRVMHEAETQGSAVRDLTMKSPSLEKVFLHLTGKGLRE